MNFISRIIKSINAMRERLKIERHEAMYGPHFNEECALKEEIANMVRQNYNEFKAKKEAASKYDEEMEKCKDILDQLEAQVEAPIITNTIDNSKEINDLKNDVADIRKMIEDTKKMFMGGFPKPPMPPMPNVPAAMK